MGAVKTTLRYLVSEAMNPISRKAKINLSYSQNGEDLIAFSWLVEVMRVKPSAMRYFDIGANDPIFFNNTYLFYTHGASGLLVEPNPDLTGPLKRTRHRDKVIAAAVGVDVDQRTATLTKFADPLFNTISHVDEATSMVGSASIGQISVPTVQVNQLMQEYGTPHFLSIDAEGMDFRILQTIDFSQYKPWIISLETTHGGIDQVSVFLSSRGYNLLAQTPANGLFRLH